MKGDGLTVGVTFYLHDEARSIFANGGHQNVAFLAEALRNCRNVARVININAGPGDEPPADMMYDGLTFERFEAVSGQLDVLIECGAQIPKKYADKMHARGGKVVAYKFGNHYVLDSQKLCDGRGDQLAFNGTRFDAVWTNPQHEHTNRSFWEALYRCPVVVLPHLWEPTFVEKVAKKLDVDFRYKPRKGPKRIAIYEPNIEVVKTCQIPMLVCELAFRKRPDLIDTVWVTNANELKKQLTFITFYNMLDIAKAKAADGKRVCSCEGRYNLVQFQATNADACVAWQWENGLNYAYYELLYGGYPLVHNSDFLPAGVGYRYSGFDAHDGADALIAALSEHDAGHEQYADLAAGYLETRGASWQPNVERHEQALAQLN